MKFRIVTTLCVLLGVGTLQAETEHIDFFELLLKSTPRGYIAAIGAPEREPETENPREAFEWRLQTMQDEYGRIPPGAYQRANAHRRNNKKTKTKGGLSSLDASISPFSWISRGPQNVGGRTLALLVHPTNNQILFAGSASGGIWKSTNAGATWAPVNDFMANLFIGALAFDPLNANTMYAGTGERFYDRIVRNAGIFKSTNGGVTWTQLTSTANWEDVQAIAPQPGSSNTLLAATGDGIYRTTDGGTTWSQATVPDMGAAQGVAFDPSNGTRAVAAVFRNDGDVRAYYSTDGGLTFTAATGTTAGGNDIAVAYAPSQPATVYAVVDDNGTSELWRSTDNGVTYTQQTSGSFGCIDRRCTLWVSPTDPNLLVTGGLHIYRSANGGTSFTRISLGDILTNDPHPDQHCITNDSSYNGTSNRRVYFCTDGGVWRSSDITTAAVNSTWTPLTATYQTTQFYSGAGHAVGSGVYLGGAQDNGTLRTSNFSNTATVATGGDGAFVEIDPNGADTWYTSSQNLDIFRTLNGGANFSFISTGITGSRNFIAPFVLDPNNTTTLYAGAAALWRTTNATSPTVTWSAIRPANFGNISAIAVAPSNSNVVYVGQTDGGIGKTTNATATTPTWTDVDNNTSVNPLPDRYVTRIYCDPANSNIVYVAFGGFAFDNLWKSTNGGTTFVSVSGSGATSLPPAPLRGIVRHPFDASRLYAGTDVGIFESDNGGASWLTSEAGPSDATIDELRFVNGTEILLAATHGRGLWTADLSGLSQPPTNLVATASSVANINLSWTGVSGATSYEIWRSVDNGAYSLRTTVNTTTFADSTVLANKTYLYKVRSVVTATVSGDSNVDFATTILFTFDNALAGKLYNASYLQEMRSAVNAVRVSSGLATLTFSSPGTAGLMPKTTDISELRTGLTAAYNQLGLTPPSFGGTIVAGSTIVTTSHWQEIRNATK
jgi:hypothetical protein